MKTIHQTTTTAAGQKASYGVKQTTTWITFNHGQQRHTAIFATPGWRGGLARIRELISRHGIQIEPEHKCIFGILENAA